MTQPTDPNQPDQPQGPNPPPPWANEPASPPPPWAGQPGGSTPAGGPKRRPWVARHKILTGLGALFAVGIIGSAVGGGADQQPISEAAASDTQDTTKGTALDPNASPASVVPPAPEVTDTAQPTTAEPEPPAEEETTAAPPPAEPELTTSQEQAIGSAESYLEFSAFSRLGLINQLSSQAGEGFSKADATFAVDYLKVNWKEQAVKSAKSYLQTGNFSRAGLIQQLSSSAGEQFTRAEATYAADKVGL